MSNRFTYDQAPQRVYWETTSACDLACRHCRAEAAPERDPAELSTDEGRRLLERLTAFGTPLPHVVLTGGDPLKRDDLFDLIGFARGLGFGVSVAPSATPLLTSEAIRHLRAAGVDAISLSLDGSNAERHDFIRGIAGTYERTLTAGKTAREVGLPFQVNTLVCQATVDDLAAIHEQVVAMGAARWSLFFLVTVGRGHVLEPISPERTEELLVWVADLAAQRMVRPGRSGLVITTTEAPQLRRVVAEQRRAAEHASVEAPVVGSGGHPVNGGHPGNHGQPANGASHAGSAPQTGTSSHAAAAPEAGSVSAAVSGTAGAAPASPVAHAHGGAHHGAGIRDGNGILFISNTGEICPSGFLEVSTGNVRKDDIVEVYRSSPLFVELREPDGFGGRCGHCEYRFACGGSRARAYSASGDPLAEDPLCPHVPAVPAAALSANA